MTRNVGNWYGDASRLSAGNFYVMNAFHVDTINLSLWFYPLSFTFLHILLLPEVWKRRSINRFSEHILCLVSPAVLVSHSQCRILYLSQRRLNHSPQKWTFSVNSNHEEMASCMLLSFAWPCISTWNFGSRSERPDQLYVDLKRNRNDFNDPGILTPIIFLLRWINLWTIYMHIIMKSTPRPHE